MGQIFSDPILVIVYFVAIGLIPFLFFSSHRPLFCGIFLLSLGSFLLRSFFYGISYLEIIVELIILCLVLFLLSFLKGRFSHGV